MNMILLQAVNIPKDERVTVVYLLIAAIMALSSVVVHLYRSKEKAIKERDEKLLDIINEHQRDLKESNNDFVKLSERYHEFTRQLRDEIINRKT